MNNTLFGKKIETRYFVLVLSVTGIFLYWLFKEQSSDVLNLFSLVPFFGLQSSRGDSAGYSGGGYSGSGSGSSGSSSGSRGGSAGGGGGSPSTGQATASYNGQTQASRSMSQAEFNGRMSAAGGTVSSSYGRSSSASFSDGSTASWSGNSNGGNSGGGTGGESSTPFLYIKKDGRFSMENDVMFGRPCSRFANLEEGIRAYNEGKIAPDLYLIQRPIEVEKDGKIKLQLREIEPEISAVFDFSLKKLIVPADKQVVVKSDFSGTILAESNSFIECTIEKEGGVDLTSTLALSKGTNREAVSFESGEYLNITFKLDADTDDHYLLLESWYRDWTMGDIYSNAKAGFVVSPYTAALNKVTRYTKRGVLATFVAFIMGYVGFGNISKNDREQGNPLVNNFSINIPVANADVPGSSSGSSSGSTSSGSTSGSSSGSSSGSTSSGSTSGSSSGSSSGKTSSGFTSSGSNRSLEVSYRDKETLQKFDVIEPRYARPSLVAIKVPAESIVDGKAHLQIKATKRHKVSGLAVVRGKTVTEDQYENLTLESVFHHREQREYVDRLMKEEGNYVKTYPSDVVTMTFDSGYKAVQQQEEARYLISIGGVYAPANREDQVMVGDWVKKLDEDALSFLSLVYKENFNNKKS